MGKGSIISHDGDGLYTVTVRYDTSGISTAISTLEGIIAELETIISDPESTQREILFAKIRKMAAEKRIDYLQGKTPSDETVSAWCADLTTNLSGEVGTIEIARNKNKGLLIQPGYEGNAVYDQARDGQLVPTMAMPPVNNYVNLGLLPGMQKWAPGYRTGTITAIDHDANTCDVSLDSMASSQQGLDVNQAPSLSGVPVDYMTCNSAAFEAGDNVVVKFQDYDWDQPKVIGFKTNPQPCAGPLQFTLNGEAVTKPIDIYLFTSDGYEMTGPFVTDATGFLASDDLEIPPGGNFTELYAAVYYRNQDGLGNYDEMLFDFWREDTTNTTESNVHMYECTETNDDGYTITAVWLSVESALTRDGPYMIRIDKKWSANQIGIYPTSEVDGETVYNIDITGLKVVEVDHVRYPDVKPPWYDGSEPSRDGVYYCDPGSDTVISTKEIVPIYNPETDTGRMHCIPDLDPYGQCYNVFYNDSYAADIALSVTQYTMDDLILCADCAGATREYFSYALWRRTNSPSDHKNPLEYFILADDRGEIIAEPEKTVYIDETIEVITQCGNDAGEPADCDDWNTKCVLYDPALKLIGTQWDHLYAKNKTGF